VAIGMSAGADVRGIARRLSATATVASRIGSSQPWWSVGSPAVITPRLGDTTLSATIAQIGADCPTAVLACAAPDVPRTAMAMAVRTPRAAKPASGADCTNPDTGHVSSRQAITDRPAGQEPAGSGKMRQVPCHR
jgi:hypothetical protein